MTVFEQDWLVVMVMGGVFVLLGLAAVLWGRGEEKSYYDSLAARPDAREFLEHTPDLPRSGALRIGGWIAIFVGVFLLVIGLVLLR